MPQLVQRKSAGGKLRTIKRGLLEGRHESEGGGYQAKDENFPWTTPASEKVCTFGDTSSPSVESFVACTQDLYSSSRRIDMVVTLKSEKYFGSLSPAMCVIRCRSEGRVDGKVLQFSA